MNIAILSDSGPSVAAGASDDTGLASVVDTAVVVLDEAVVVLDEAVVVLDESPQAASISASTTLRAKNTALRPVIMFGTPLRPIIVSDPPNAVSDCLWR
jgi:hypothetical protein